MLAMVHSVPAIILHITRMQSAGHGLDRVCIVVLSDAGCVGVMKACVSRPLRKSNYLHDVSKNGAVLGALYRPPGL